MAGPEAGWPGRFAELLHVRWLLDFGASEPVLAAQRRGIPEIYRAAAQPAASDLFGQLRAGAAGVGEAMAATRRLLPGSDPQGPGS